MNKFIVRVWLNLEVKAENEIEVKNIVRDMSIAITTKNDTVNIRDVQVKSCWSREELLEQLNDTESWP